MSKKSTKVDKLVDLLKDEKVTELLVERLETTLSPAIEDMIERKLDKIIEKVLLKLNPIIEVTVKASIDAHQEKLLQQLSNLEATNTKLRIRLDHAETESRAVNLMIHGLVELDAQSTTKDMSDSETVQAVLNLCNTTLGLSISESEISTAFRLPRKGKEKFRPVLVKFVTLRTRKMVYGARSALKKTHIYINEHLTASNALIYAKTRRLVKEGKAMATWSTGGVIYLRLTDEQGTKPLRISDPNDLDKMFPDPNFTASASSE